MDDSQLMATFRAAGFGEDEFTHSRNVRIVTAAAEAGWVSPDITPPPSFGV